MNLDVNCFLLTEGSVFGGPYLYMQRYENAWATSTKQMSYNSTTKTSFLHRFAIKMMYKKPRLLSDSGSKVSITTESSGLNAGNNFKGIARLHEQAQFFFTIHAIKGSRGGISSHRRPVAGPPEEWHAFVSRQGVLLIFRGAPSYTFLS